MTLFHPLGFHVLFLFVGRAVLLHNVDIFILTSNLQSYNRPLVPRRSQSNEKILL